MESRIVGRYNGHELRVAKLLGHFTWHSHAETDELFLVIEGNLAIECRDGTRHLGPGEMLVIPAGIEHRPFALSEAQVLLIDREGEPNTGLNPSQFTRPLLDDLA